MQIPIGATSYCPPAGRITAGRFTGHTLRHTVRPRGSRDWLMIYTLAGGGEYRQQDGGLGHRSQAREVTLFRPGAFQDYRSTSEGWDLFFAHFLPRDEWRDWLNWPEFAPGAMGLEIGEASHERLLGAWETLLRCHASSLRRAENFTMAALEEIILWCDEENPQAAGPKRDERIQRACDHLSAHLDRPFQETELTRVTGLSPSRLRHLFREQVGESPRDYHEGRKMRRARQLLSLSRQTVAEIADALGYENPFYFTLRFKKETGQSPREYRQAHLR